MLLKNKISGIIKNCEELDLYSKRKLIFEINNLVEIAFKKNFKLFDKSINDKIYKCSNCNEIYKNKDLRKKKLRCSICGKEICPNCFAIKLKKNIYCTGCNKLRKKALR